MELALIFCGVAIAIGVMDLLKGSDPDGKAAEEATNKAASFIDKLFRS